MVTSALVRPGFGPARIAAELAWPQCGRHPALSQRRLAGAQAPLAEHPAQILCLIAGYAVVAEPAPNVTQPERRLDASGPVELVQFECFHVGRRSGATRTVWQYTAIDMPCTRCGVASDYTRAELRTTPPNPLARWIWQLARRVAQDLADRGWRLERVMTDNGFEFRARAYGRTVAELGTAIASSTPADRRTTAASSGSRARSSERAGSRPSPAT